MNRDAPHATVSIRKLGETEAQPVDLGDRLLSLTYEDNAKLADEVKLTLDNYDFALLDDPLFRLHNELEVSYGYRGEMSSARRCVICEMGGGLIRTVRGIGQATWMDRETKSRIWENVTRSDVVKAIFAEHGFGSDVVIEDTEVVYPQISQVKQTDAQFVAALAAEEEFVFFVGRTSGGGGHGKGKRKRGGTSKGGKHSWKKAGGAVAHFHRQDLDQEPVARYTWTGKTFAEDPDSMFVSEPKFSEEIKGKVGAVTQKGTDPVSKKPIEASRSNENHKEPTLGTSIETFDQRTGQSLGLVVKAASEHTAPTSAPTEAAAKREADAKYRKGRNAQIKMTCTVVGNPDVGTHDMIEVSAVGQRLSGLWYVTKAKHKPIGAGPYTTDLECTRDAHFGYADPKRDVKAKGALNSKDAPAGGASEDLEPVEIFDPRTGESIGTSYRPRH